MATEEWSQYIPVIRRLLLAAFQTEQLRPFLEDRPPLRPIVNSFGPGQGLDDMVDKVIGYCDKNVLFIELLAGVKEVNPRQYARFESELPEFPPDFEPAALPCPYRGLEPFEAEHARFYFGRDDMVERLVAQVKEHRFVAVVGPSGCGKSSLVRAGLVTELQRGALPGSRDWAVRIFRPGKDPLRALSAPLVALLEPEASEVTRIAEIRTLADRLREGTLSLADVVTRLGEVRPDVPRLVLVVDQFEELYTECEDEALRQAFLDALLAAKDQNVTVVLALRADFYGHVLADRTLGEAVDAGVTNVLVMAT
jgi:energy-coupling factor transporter ATP-binding protein EcfA2